MGIEIIGVYKDSCPTGWSQVTDSNGNFLQGKASYGAVGGSSTHTHTVSFPSTVTGNASAFLVYDPPVISVLKSTHTHSVGAKNGLVSNSGQNEPEYITVVFCSYEEDFDG
jgi:hypothetical protein